jgi:CHAD domain-containing protein
MLSPDNDESLHSFRKHVKDIIYNIRVFAVGWGIPFPVTAWKSEKKLNELADELGNYNDRCTTLKFVQTDYIDQLPADEKDVVLDLNVQWMREKKEQQEHIIMKLKDLQLLPSVKVI